MDDVVDSVFVCISFPRHCPPLRMKQHPLERHDLVHVMGRARERMHRDGRGERLPNTPLLFRRPFSLIP
ncbi:MAG: hypothetical protein JZU64_15545, partial [Rhodoferax sp.]|nr:hypothetical protein [Rhodoferax sp.]